MSRARVRVLGGGTCSHPQAGTARGALVEPEGAGPPGGDREPVAPAPGSPRSSLEPGHPRSQSIATDGSTGRHWGLGHVLATAPWTACGRAHQELPGSRELAPFSARRDGCWVCSGLVLGEVGWGYIWVSIDGRGTRVLQIISGHWAGVMILVSGPTDTLVSGMGAVTTQPAGCHLRLRAHYERPSGPPGPEQAL